MESQDLGGCSSRAPRVRRHGVSARPARACRARPASRLEVPEVAASPWSWQTGRAWRSPAWGRQGLRDFGRPDFGIPKSRRSAVSPGGCWDPKIWAPGCSAHLRGRLPLVGIGGPSAGRATRRHRPARTADRRARGHSPSFGTPTFRAGPCGRGIGVGVTRLMGRPRKLRGLELEAIWTGVWLPSRAPAGSGPAMRLNAIPQRGTAGSHLNRAFQH